MQNGEIRASEQHKRSICLKFPMLERTNGKLLFDSGFGFRAARIPKGIGVMLDCVRKIREPATLAMTEISVFRVSHRRKMSHDVKCKI